MLAAAKLLGEIFSKFKQPAIIGEILAGIILGPTVLGMFAPNIFELLFPSKSEIKIALDGITNIAVVLLLLVSGLEVDLSIVFRHRKVAASTSIIGIIVPFGLGFCIAYLFPDVLGLLAYKDRLVFSLFIGTAIAISSLPVIAKILMDLKLFKTQIGFIIIAAAMLNDLIGWFIFSVILGMIGANAHGLTFSETLLYTIIFITLLLVFGRKLINKLIPMIQEKLSFPGSILNFILILGFLSAAFTEYLGIHSILGAFIMGIAIGDSTHLTERTREIIHQFITNIFAPLFFVSIGMRANFITHFDIGIVAIFLALALIGKVAGCGIGARLGGMKKNEALAVGAGMSSSGAMGIIIGLLALQFGLIHETLFVGLVIMALFTSIFSAPMMTYFLKKKEKNTFKALLKETNIIYCSDDGKVEILTKLTLLAEQELKIDHQQILEKVLSREKMLPTGIANFLAVPHAKLKMKNPFVAIAINTNGVDFEAADGLPSKIIILLLTPEDNNELQLQLLSEIASNFKNKEEVEKLLTLKKTDDLLATLRNQSK